jgi:hypothetical protein
MELAHQCSTLLDVIQWPHAGLYVAHTGMIVVMNGMQACTCDWNARPVALIGQQAWLYRGMRLGPGGGWYQVPHNAPRALLQPWGIHALEACVWGDCVCVCGCGVQQGQGYMGGGACLHGPQLTDASEMQAVTRKWHVFPLTVAWRAGN